MSKSNKVVKSTNKPKSARLQVDPESIPDDDKPPQTGSVFNVWYLKWSGGDSSSNPYTKLNFRVNIKKDSGYTKAKHSNYICLFFARGCCYLGKNCPYLHRLPTSEDYFMPTQDCFGRDKTSEYKDDMSGVGSFKKINKTLYIGGLTKTNNSNIQNILTKHFEEFGNIEKIKILFNKNCAFITYKLEYQAQFAKEAMQNQSILGDDILNIKWANEDPDPNSQKQKQNALEDEALNTVKKLLNDKSKDNKVTVQEFESEGEEEGGQEHHEQKQITNESLNSIFGNTDLSILSKLKTTQVQNKNINSLLNYSSDDD